jgi:hypothetical protein
MVLTQSTYTLFSIIMREKKLNTKNLLMFVVLSAGILTVLSGTGMSQVQSAFAEKEECEDNDDNNCNDKKIEQENDCKIVIKNDDGSNSNSNTAGDITCENFGANPEDVSGLVGHRQSQEQLPFDSVFGPIS